jgi:hypothetical protein
MALGLLLSCWGCSAADPCDGLQGTCVSARVEGQPATVDQLRITVDGRPPAMLTPTPRGAPFSLPVRVALVFSAAPGASAAITVEGLVGGAAVGSSGKQMVPLSPNGKSSFTFELAPLSGDGGGDMTAHDLGPDLTPPPNVVSFEPASFTFPDTPRGTKQATLADILVTNNTGQARTTTNVTTTGDMNSFHFEPQTTCPMGPSGVTLPPGQCHMILSFTPVAAGALQQVNTVMFDDNETLTLTFKGNGQKEWSVEGPFSGNLFRAVWASGPNDWWVAGSNPTNCPIMHSAGDGQWQGVCNGVTTRNFYSVGGSGPNDVWFGGDNGDLWHYTGNGNFTQLTGVGPAATLMRGIIVFSATDARVIDAAGTLYCMGSGTFAPCSGLSQTGFAATSLSGVQDQAWAGGLNGHMMTYALGSATWANYTMPSGLTSMDVNGVWVAPNANHDIFAVGDAGGTSTNTPALFHYSNTIAPAVSESPGSALGALLAVAGRVDATSGALDVYAVGSIGQQVLHTTGNGQWNQLQVGGAAGVNNKGVWVTSDGQVVIASDTGQILHYY